MASKEYIGLERLGEAFELLYDKLEDLLAAEYDETKAYAGNDICLHNGLLYTCRYYTTGTWDPNAWEQISLGNGVTMLIGGLTYLQTGMNEFLSQVIQEYDSSSTYNKGDWCCHDRNGRLTFYRCISDTPVTGTWDVTKWEQKTITEALSEASGGGSSYTEGDGIDISNNEISVDTTFTEASTRVNIASGDPLATIWGKIKKFFTDLKAVAFSGSYNDLSDKPTIPSVGNGTLTIQKNGTNVQTFTANQSGNATANITVPTNTNELTNGAGFITSSETAANVSGTVAIANGGTGATTRLAAAKNLTNEAVSSPNYFVGMTSSWGKFGYTSVAQAKSVLGLSDYLPLSGGSMTGTLGLSGYDLILGTSSSSSNDSGDVTFSYGNGNEKARIWTEDTYTSAVGPKYRVKKLNGTTLYEGRLAIVSEIPAANEAYFIFDNYLQSDYVIAGSDTVGYVKYTYTLSAGRYLIMATTWARNTSSGTSFLGIYIDGVGNVGDVAFSRTTDHCITFCKAVTLSSAVSRSFQLTARKGNTSGVTIPAYQSLQLIAIRLS